MGEERTDSGGEEKVIVIEIGLRDIVYVSIIIVVLAFTALLFLDYFKPRLTVETVCFPNTVVISGRLMNGFSPVSGVYVAIQVKDDKGATVWIDTVKTSEDGYFKSVFALSKETTGKLEAYVNSEIASERTTFTVGR